MDVAHWNCRGICNDNTRRAFRDILRQTKPLIAFLCETKVRTVEEFLILKRELGFDNGQEVLSGGRTGKSGGLALFWSSEVDLRILSTSEHHIDAEIHTGPSLPVWRLTGFYGYAKTADRHRSWELLRELGDTSSLPWVVVGDFNEILNNGEKIDGPPRSERQMRGFREALGYCDLLDLGFHGSRATWWNSETHLRLDRVVCTPTWWDIFGHSKVYHLPPSLSDHVPVLLRASETPIQEKLGHHRFKFEAIWLDHHECEGVVRQAWAQHCEGIPMFQVVKRIAYTRTALDKWQRGNFKMRQQQMLAVRQRLEELLEGAASPSVHDEQVHLMQQLQAFLSQEEQFWKQRSKVLWLKEGDRNTGFFHRKASKRRRRNRLIGLLDSEGVLQEGDDAIEGIVSKYFTDIFTASPLDYEAMHTTLETIAPSVTPSMNAMLCAPYTVDEVREALFQMGPLKSPGPDGMPPLFFQHYWKDIGGEVAAAVLHFLHTGILLKQVNFTHICLIPKVKNPTSMSDLRPIALCNVLYKICSKTIANRLKKVLPDIVSPFQSAFIPGRLITDNILVANEFAHFIHNKRTGREGYMALKLDLSKAYDRMEWEFLRRVMLRFGFSVRWVNLVMQCVTTPRFSFIIRGKPRGLVIPSRGLRQGDPLSPYLFLLGAEGFSALLQRKQELGLLPGISICGDAPAVNHLLFADDSMLYARANLETCYEIQDVIETYGRASGQLVNYAKSSVVFSKNVGDELQEEIVELMGIVRVDSHDKYLGLPTYVGRKKSEKFQYIQERLAEKLDGFAGQLMNGAAKDISIRVVAQTLPNYAMSVFKLTDGFNGSLEQQNAKFWWGSSEGKRKIHWKSWPHLCLPKEEGGLGFRSLSDFNDAMLAKQAWRVVTNPDALVSRIFKAKYFPDSTFWEAVEHYAPSYSWRSLFGTRDILKQGLLWQIGNGTAVRVWDDPWVPGLPYLRPMTGGSDTNAGIRVCDLMFEWGGWDEPLVRDIFTEVEAEAILSIHIPARRTNDRLVWKLEKKGTFSVKSTYRFVFSQNPVRPPMVAGSSVVFWKKLWQSCIPNSVKVFIWKLCIDILPTCSTLVKRHVQLDSQDCRLCVSCMESTLHIGRDCAFSRNVLGTNVGIASKCLGTETEGMSMLEWLMFCLSKVSLGVFEELLMLIWGIWMERNARVWKGKTGDVRSVTLHSMSRLHDFRRYNSKDNGVRGPKPRYTWKPAELGVLKVNFDGSFRESSGNGAFGVVVRDSGGVLVCGFGNMLPRLSSAEHAELLACKAAMEFVVSEGLQQVVFETDCLVLETNMRSVDPVLSELGRLYEDVRLLLHAIPNSSIQFAGKSANIAAHTMAAEVYTRNSTLYYTSPPSFLVQALLTDSCIS